MLGDDHDDESTERLWAVSLFSVCMTLLYADQNSMPPNLTVVAAEFGFDDEERDQKLGGTLE